MYQQKLQILLMILLFNISIVSEANDRIKNLTANMELSSGYNSNVFYGSQNELIEETSTESASDIQHSIILNAGYKYFNGSNSDAKLYVDYYYDKLQDNDVDYSTIDLSLPYSYYTKTLRLRVTPLLSSFKSSGVSALQNYGISLNLTLKLGFYRAGISSLIIKNKVIDESYSAYEGSSNNAYVFLEKHSFSSQTSLKLGVANYNYQLTIDGDESNAVYYIGSNYLFFKGRKEIVFTGKVQAKKYVTDPFNGFNRTDYNVKLSVAPAYRLSKSIKLFVKAQYVINSSNLVTETEDKNYDQTQFNIGVAWRLY